MCLGIPGRVLEPGDGHDLAVVEVEGVARQVHVGLLDDPPQPGDWVIIHLGFALSTIDEAEAKSSLDFVTGRDGAFGER